MVGRSVVERLDRAREAVSEAQSERARANAYVVLILQTTCARASMDANACVWMGGVVIFHHQDGFRGRACHRTSSVAKGLSSSSSSLEWESTRTADGSASGNVRRACLSVNP